MGSGWSGSSARNLITGYYSWFMAELPSDLQIQRLLNDCEQAWQSREWERLDRLVQQVLLLDPNNGAAQALQRLAAERTSTTGGFG